MKYLIIILLCFPLLAMDSSTVDNGDGSFTYTQKVDENSNPPYYIAPNGYGFGEYSYFNEDYGWKHSFTDYEKFNINILSATLLIRGYDVDSEPFRGTSGEYDGISVDGVDLNPGLLQGTNGTWSETSFDIPLSSIMDDGEMTLFVDIDMQHNSRVWATTLDYSKITITYDIIENEKPYIPELESSSSSVVTPNSGISVDVVGPFPADPDGESVEYSYRWFVDVGQGYAVDDEFAGKPDHTTNHVPASSVEVYEIWTVEVTAKDSKGAISSKASLTFPEVTNDSDGDGVEDDVDLYPEDASRSSVQYYPSQSSNNTLIYEDLWPIQGDYDMNDFVTLYSDYRVLDGNGDIKELGCTFEYRARGADFRNGFAISFDGVSSFDVESAELTKGGSVTSVSHENGHNNALVYVVSNNLHDELPASGGYTFYNTHADDNRSSKTVELKIVFTSPVSQVTFPESPYNPFLFRVDQRELEIHIVGKEPTSLASLDLFDTEDDASISSGEWYRNDQGLPWAMEVTGTVQHPLEELPVSSAYPKVLDWVSSRGAQFSNWASFPVNEKIWK